MNLHSLSGSNCTLKCSCAALVRLESSSNSQSDALVYSLFPAWPFPSIRPLEPHTLTHMMSAAVLWGDVHTSWGALIMHRHSDRYCSSEGSISTDTASHSLWLQHSPVHDFCDGLQTHIRAQMRINMGRFVYLLSVFFISSFCLFFFLSCLTFYLSFSFFLSIFLDFCLSSKVSNKAFSSQYFLRANFAFLV